MFRRKKPDVLISGAGPVGMFAALTLAQRGVPVQIVDREWRTGTHSYALALHAQSVKLLDQMGLLAPVLERAYRVRHVGIYEGMERRGTLSLGDLQEDFSFVAVMRQDVLEDLFEQALRKVGVKVQWNHEVTVLETEQDHVAATVDHLEKAAFGYAVAHSEWVIAKSSTVDVPFVIGADGHRSRVRRTLGIDYETVGPAQYFAVFEFKTDADLGHEMALVFEDDLTNVMWPLPDGRCRWSFQLADLEAQLPPRKKDRVAVQIGGAPYPVLTEMHLRRFLRTRVPWFEGSIDHVDWRIVVRFEPRLAQRFGEGRMWLAGDAAHMTGPAGIQSMNVGLEEAYALGNTLADILKGTAWMEGLEDYAKRRDVWRFLLGLEGGLQPTEAAPDWAHRLADRLVLCLPASGRDLAALVQQIGLEVTQQTPVI